MSVQSKKNNISLTNQNIPIVTAFFTQLPHRQLNFLHQQSKQLNQYINNLHQKLQYANWKQKLTLFHNFEPLLEVIEKTQHNKKQHIQKYNEKQQKYEKIYEIEKTQGEVSSYKEFSQKLQKKLAQILKKINKCQQTTEKHIQTIKQKKTQLNYILDNNHKLNIEILKSKHIFNKTDILHAFNRRIQSVKSLKQIQKSDRKSQSIVKVVKKDNKALFMKCLQQVKKNVKKIRSDTLQRIQAINRQNLDIKNKLITEILMKTFKQRSNKEFNIQWQSFKKLKSKQILQMLIQKGRIQSIINISQNWN